MSHHRLFSRFLCLTLLLTVAMPQASMAAGGGMAPAPVAPRSAEAEYNKGLQAKDAKRYSDAISSFRKAVDIKSNYPEAWNELGFALRQSGQYPEAIKAYEQALKLRPNYPNALEYLGEAYVKMGKLDDAKAILARLNPLDTARAKELDEAIQNGQ
jgi:tetratricopeptide (TPR) repeat protein